MRQGAQTILVAHCSATGSLFAHAVPRKGMDVDGFVIEQLREDVLWLGHSQIMMRSDNDPALVQVIERTPTVLKLSGVQNAAPEGSVPYDPN